MKLLFSALLILRKILQVGPDWTVGPRFNRDENFREKAYD